MDSRFDEISGSEFEFAQLAERGGRGGVELQRFFEELARVTRAIVVAGEHGVVQQVLNFYFVFGIRQSLSRLAGVARRRDLRLPPSHFGLHGLQVSRIRRIEVFQFLWVGLQVVEFGPRSFDQLSIVGAQGS